MRGFISKAGIKCEFSNLSGYDESRQMHLTCPICLTRFHRPPSHVARNKGATTCSRSCAAEARKVRIEAICVSCGVSMNMTPSNAERVVTCSKECSTLRRVKDIKTVKSTSLGGYHKAAKNIAMRGICMKCDGTIGPWVVRNLKAKVLENGVTVVDESGADLWCKRCHLVDVAPDGAVARKIIHGW